MSIQQIAIVGIVMTFLGLLFIGSCYAQVEKYRYGRVSAARSVMAQIRYSIMDALIQTDISDRFKVPDPLDENDEYGRCRLSDIILIISATRWGETKVMSVIIHPGSNSSFISVTDEVLNKTQDFGYGTRDAREAVEFCKRTLWRHYGPHLLKPGEL